MKPNQAWLRMPASAVLSALERSVGLRFACPPEFGLAKRKVDHGSDSRVNGGIRPTVARRD